MLMDGNLLPGGGSDYWCIWEDLQKYADVEVNANWQ